MQEKSLIKANHFHPGKKWTFIFCQLEHYIGYRQMILMDFQYFWNMTVPAGFVVSLCWLLSVVGWTICFGRKHSWSFMVWIFSGPGPDNWGSPSNWEVHLRNSSLSWLASLHSTLVVKCNLHQPKVTGQAFYNRIYFQQ